MTTTDSSTSATFSEHTPTSLTDESAFIPGLEPYGLGRVPGYRTKLVPNDTGGWREIEDEAWRTEWFAWRDAVNALRLDIHYALENASRDVQRLELALCAKDPAYWLAIYGWIDEPRAIDGESYFKEFTPFAYQVKLLQWFVEQCDSPRIFDGYISKARGLGATWILCAGATWGWLFREWRGVLVSRKEDLVDKPQDLNSMFGKIDLLIEMLPKWMEPEGYDPHLHRLKMMVRNPNSRAQITGESTTKKATRGARATYIIYDEAAFIPDFQSVYATGAGTTKHRFAVSSESHDEGYYWWDTWNAIKEIKPDAVWELDYFHNAYFDSSWFIEEKARWEGHDPEGFNREYLRDPWSGFGTAVYPLAANLGKSDLGYVSGLPLLVGIDPGLADDTAIVFAQWEGDGLDRRLRFVDSYENNRLPAEFYAHILTGIPIEMGDKCYGLRMTGRDKQVMRWLYDVPYNMMQVACDPAGGQRDSSGLSFVERIILESLRLREREYGRMLEKAAGQHIDKGFAGSAAYQDALLNTPRPKAITPFYKDLYRANRYDQRQQALRTLLTRAVFSPTVGAERIQQALRKYRFNDPGTNSTTQPKPVHDMWSHLVTACEFLATWIDLNVIGFVPRPVTDDGFALERAKIASRLAA